MGAISSVLPSDRGEPVILAVISVKQGETVTSSVVQSAEYLAYLAYSTNDRLRLLQVYVRR